MHTSFDAVGTSQDFIPKTHSHVCEKMYTVGKSRKPPKSPSVRGWSTHYNVSTQQNTAPPYTHSYLIYKMSLDFMLYW